MFVLYEKATKNVVLVNNNNPNDRTDDPNLFGSLLLPGNPPTININKQWYELDVNMNLVVKDLAIPIETKTIQTILTKNDADITASELKTIILSLARKAYQ